MTSGHGAEPNNTEPAIRAENLWKVFGDHPTKAMELAAAGADREDIKDQTASLVAVRDVSFEVAEAESFVVMGLSGSGKSTLIRCLARLIEPTDGQVRLCGHDVVGLDDDQLRELRRHRLAMVFQHFGLFPHRTVIDNAAYGLEVQGVAKAERRQQAAEQLKAVGLEGWGDHYPQQLSGGMQQRVGLARALTVDPDVLFFDEPFSALDPLIRRSMQDELIELQKQQRRTIVFITHDFDEALRIADRIAIMKDGAFEQVGTAAEILTSPATPDVEAFTANAPKAKILTVANAMVDLDGSDGNEGGVAGATIAESCTLEQALPVLLGTDTDLAVVDAEGAVTGRLTRRDVADLLTGS